MYCPKLCERAEMNHINYIDLIIRSSSSCRIAVVYLDSLRQRAMCSTTRRRLCLNGAELRLFDNWVSIPAQN